MTRGLPRPPEHDSFHPTWPSQLPPKRPSIGQQHALLTLDVFPRAHSMVITAWSLQVQTDRCGDRQSPGPRGSGPVAPGGLRWASVEVSSIRAERRILDVPKGGEQIASDQLPPERSKDKWRSRRTE